jgi:lipoprotein-anchoring transpeptidase ErfK/SrfK
MAIERTLVVSVQARTVQLSGPGPTTRWSYVLHDAQARTAPSPAAAAVEAVPAITSDATPNLVRVLAERRTASAGDWVRVVLTTLPNGRTGWVPRRSLSVFHAVHTHLVVDTRTLTLSLFRAGKRVFQAPVGVGQTRWPTPHGTFYVRERLTNFHDAVYGPLAFGTNARSPTLTDWPGGGIVGIHGTNQPELVPGRISHGCIRLRNPDILRLARLLPLGTPISIR